MAGDGDVPPTGVGLLVGVTLLKEDGAPAVGDPEVGTAVPQAQAVGLAPGNRTARRGPIGGTNVEKLFHATTLARTLAP